MTITITDPIFVAASTELLEAGRRLSEFDRTQEDRHSEFRTLLVEKLVAASETYRIAGSSR